MQKKKNKTATNLLVGCFSLTHLKNMHKSNWIICPRIGVKIQKIIELSTTYKVGPLPVINGVITDNPYKWPYQLVYNCFFFTPISGDDPACLLG